MKVRICSTYYTVIGTNEPIISDNNLCCGVISYDNTKIQVATNLGKEQYIQALVHECTHGILYEHGQAEAKDNESLVHAIATGVIGLIRDNPELVQKIQEVDSDDKVHKNPNDTVSPAAIV